MVLRESLGLGRKVPWARVRLPKRPFIIASFFLGREIKDSFKGSFDGKSCDLSKNFIDLFDNYKQYENLAIERLKNEEEFPPRPLEPKVCSYCDLNKFCPRRVGGEHARS